MPSFEVAITGMSCASALGEGPAALRSALARQESGLSHQHRFQDWIAAPLGALPWDRLGITPNDPWKTDEILLEGCHRLLLRLLEESGLLQRYPSERVGLWIGTTTAGINGFHRAAREKSQVLQPDMYQARLAEDLLARLDWQGPAWTLCTSCAASAQAFCLASDAVRHGMMDAAIVIGADVLNLVTILGFEALQLLDPEPCRPFHPERQGINLAEAIVLLSLEKQAPRPGLTVVRGYQHHSEAFHMTQPAAEGLWMRRTMEGAMQKAGIAPADIAYINPHGTATPANDSCEAAAIEQLFGPSAPRHATKGLTGHPLGASGALEILITALMLPACAAGRRRLGLTNSFGFGGADVSIVLESLP